MPTIVHVDMDAFYAAIEQRDHPEYRGRPVIVGGSRQSRRSVVATCSYEARRFGVRSAMPIQQAVRLCPDGIFLPCNFAKYRAVSREIHALFHEFTPLVEPVSLDEAYLDMTGCEHFYSSLQALGQRLKEKIKAATGLAASVGIAPNKLLAKLASDASKPDGLLILTPEEVNSFLAPLPVGHLGGIGEKTQAFLTRLGIRTVGELARLSLPFLTAHFGPTQGRFLFNLARGLDSRPVEPPGPPKSLGHEETFAADLVTPTAVRRELALLTEKVGHRLRARGLFARTLTLKARYADFRTLTRSRTCAAPFQDNDSIFSLAWQLSQTLTPGPFRLLGISVSNLTSSRQLPLFPDQGQTRAALDVVADRLNAKYGRRILGKGRSLVSPAEE